MCVRRCAWKWHACIIVWKRQVKGRDYLIYVARVLWMAPFYFLLGGIVCEQQVSKMRMSDRTQRRPAPSSCCWAVVWVKAPVFCEKTLLPLPRASSSLPHAVETLVTITTCYWGQKIMHVPLCALDLQTHFNLPFFFFFFFFILIYYYMVMMIMIVFDVIVFFYTFFI